jgi:hypothetical protein
MSICSCGLDSHMNQITDYPVGTKILFEDGKTGEVFGHCADGRATLYIEGKVHTFHHLESFVEQIALPPPSIEALQAEIARLKAENEQLQETIHQLVTDICELTDTDMVEAPYEE